MTPGSWLGLLFVLGDCDIDWPTNGGVFTYFMKVFGLFRWRKRHSNCRWTYLSFWTNSRWVVQYGRQCSKKPRYLWHMTTWLSWVGRYIRVWGILMVLLLFQHLSFAMVRNWQWAEYKHCSPVSNHKNLDKMDFRISTQWYTVRGWKMWVHLGCSLCRHMPGCIRTAAGFSHRNLLV